jgi:hypothetical protein
VATAPKSRASEARSPERSSLGGDYWLHRCEGFRVDSPSGRIGHVTGIRFDSAAKPELLEVRAGLLGRRLLLIPVGQIEEIRPEQKLIRLGGLPQLVEQD